MRKLISDFFKRKRQKARAAQVTSLMENDINPTVVEDHIVAYFKSGYTDLKRLAEALGYRNQKELHDVVMDYRVKVMLLEKGTNFDDSIKSVRDMHLIQSLRDLHAQEKVSKK